MISYELANELKYVIFPYPGNWEDLVIFDDLSGRGKVYMPSLTHLIERFGPDSFTLSGRPGSWIASFGGGATRMRQTPWIEGGTPEEATARLWLDLNRKEA